MRLRRMPSQRTARAPGGEAAVRLVPILMLFASMRQIFRHSPYQRNMDSFSG